ncbi:hypothetical protein VTJ04DRAFT_10180 [Mycothermus thermophilus]|uniref:uncharacterized protein n=1 Tax=Humicola insolens TaxID=85995 RepID=UPI0037435963
MPPPRPYVGGTAAQKSVKRANRLKESIKRISESKSSEEPVKTKPISDLSEPTGLSPPLSRSGSTEVSPREQETPAVGPSESTKAISHGQQETPRAGPFGSTKLKHGHRDTPPTLITDEEFEAHSEKVLATWANFDNEKDPVCTECLRSALKYEWSGACKAVPGQAACERCINLGFENECCPVPAVMAKESKTFLRQHRVNYCLYSHLLSPKKIAPSQEDRHALLFYLATGENIRTRRRQLH